MPIALFGATVLEQGIDQLLRLDPITRQRLALIDGKVIRVQIQSPQLEVIAMVTGGRVSIPSEFDGEVDLTISGTLASLRSLAGSTDTLHTGEVSIEGDIGVASRLKEILVGIDPDWQELVSPVIGDTATHKLERGLQGARQWLLRSRDTLGESTHDYLVDEVSLLATARDVAHFSEAVDELREDADRAAARLAILERQLSAKRCGNG